MPFCIVQECSALYARLPLAYPLTCLPTWFCSTYQCSIAVRASTTSNALMQFCTFLHLPAFAMDSTPDPVCLSVKFSSGNLTAHSTQGRAAARHSASGLDVCETSAMSGAYCQACSYGVTCQSAGYGQSGLSLINEPHSVY